MVSLRFRGRTAVVGAGLLAALSAVTGVAAAAPAASVPAAAKPPLPALSPSKVSKPVTVSARLLSHKIQHGLPVYVDARLSRTGTGTAVLQLHRGKAWTVVSHAQIHGRSFSFDYRNAALGAHDLRVQANVKGAKTVLSHAVRVAVVGSSPSAVSPYVIPVTGSVAAGLRSYDPDTGVVSFASSATPSLTGVDVGTVLASGPTATAPDGFLRVVTGRIDTPTGSVLTTRQAALSEAFPNGIPDGTALTTRTIEVTPGNGVSVASDGAHQRGTESAAPHLTVAGPSAKLHVNVSLTGDKVTENATSSTTLGLTGDVDVSPFATVSLKTHFLVPQSVSLSAGADISADLTPSVTIGGELPVKSIDLGKVKAAVCGFVGPAPICVTDTVTLSFDLSTTVEAKGSLHLTAVGRAAGNFTFDKRGATLGRETPKMTLDQPTFEGSIGLRADLGLDDAVLLYDAVGPYANVGPFAQIDLANTSGTCGYSAGIHTEVGVRGQVPLGDLLGLPHYDLSHQEDIPVLASSYNCGAASTPGPTPTPTPAPPVSTNDIPGGYDVEDGLGCTATLQNYDHDLFYNDDSYDTDACGTWASIDGTLYGPEVPAGHELNDATTDWTPVSQTQTGDGSTGNPYVITHVVDAGDTGVRLTETDTYVEGTGRISTSYHLANTDNSEHDIELYHAADCYVADDDTGYGSISQDNQAVGCVGSAQDGTQATFTSTAGTADSSEGAYRDDIWDTIASGEPFGDTCDCDDDPDNGMGLSWYAALTPGQQITDASRLDYN